MNAFEKCLHKIIDKCWILASKIPRPETVRLLFMGDTERYNLFLKNPYSLQELKENM
jgi:hypothetical protein